MTINTRDTVIGIKQETTESTLIAPDGVTAYIARQADFTLEPAIEQLENAEVKPAIGPSKTIAGLENPTASFSHYFRHSGTEGSAPAFGILLNSAIGATDTEATEYNTVAGSTVSVINVDGGEGASFRRGQALLGKDTAGYWIRPVHSISTDALTIGFNLPAAPGAPAAGVNLGKATTYYPANADHPTFSLWRYLGNGDAIESVSGCRVTSFNIDIAPGQMINASYTIEGIKYFWNPLEVTALNNYLDFTDDDATYEIAIPVGWYKDPHELAAAVQTGMNASGTSETHTCTYADSTGKFTIATSTSTLLSILWKTGTHGADGTDIHIGTLMGYADTADDTLATTYASDTAQTYASPYTPTYESNDPMIAKSHEVLIGGATDTTTFQAESVSISFSGSKADIMSVASATGRYKTVVSERVVEISLVAELAKYDVDKFKRMRANTETRFCYIGGVKSGGDWVAGKCFCIYAPTCTVSSYVISESDNRALMNITLKTYVNDAGDGEFYISFV